MLTEEQVRATFGSQIHCGQATRLYLAVNKTGAIGTWSTAKRAVQAWIDKKWSPEEWAIVRSERL